MEQVVVIPIYATIVAALLIGTLYELHDLAEQQSDKAVQYAEDMVLAMDCAVEARPLTDCSPEIFSKDVRAEIEHTQEMLKRVQQDAGLRAIA